jgi:hypothetical protein
MANIIQFVGIGIFILGGIFFLIEAFKTSLLWGLGCLFITPVTFFYLFCHWGNAKKPFSIQVIGFVIAFSSAYLSRSFS